MSQRREPSSQSLRRIRTVSVVIALAFAATAFAAIPAAPAGANDVPSWLATINSFRQSKGLAPFQLDGELTALAQQQAQLIANNGQLSHTPNLAAGISSNWTKLGENVGMGGNLDIIWSAFLNSAPHYNNLVDPAYTHIGIGVVIVGNTQWVAHRFMGVASSPPPAPAPEPQPQPVYVPPPVTAPRPTTPPTTRPAPVTTTTTVPVTVPEPEPVVVPAASAPDRAAALLDALRIFEQ